MSDRLLFTEPSCKRDKIVLLIITHSIAAVAGFFGCCAYFTYLVFQS